jgi:SnoaL-like protein
MATNEEIVRAAYHAAEGSVMDLKAWRGSFAEDGVFNMIPTGDSYTGERLDDVVTFVQGAFPDVHRELLRVNELGNDVVAIELLIQGTFTGTWPTPAGPLQGHGEKTSVPTADIIYLRDGKIQTFNCYPSINIRLAQMGVYPDFASAVKKSAEAS